jgi:hypothetical protein
MKIAGRFPGTAVQQGASAAALVAFVVMLNAPFWILSNRILMNGCVFSLDAMLLLLFFAYSRALGLALLPASWITDLVVKSSNTYHFSSPVEFLRSLRFGTQIEWRYFVSATSLFVLALFVLAFCVMQYSDLRSRLRPWQIVVALAALLTVDAMNGSSALRSTDSTETNLNIAGSSWYRIAMEITQKKSKVLTRLSTGSGGFEEVRSFLPPPESRQGGILYVIVESMGVHRKVGIQNWMRSQLYPASLQGQYRLHEARVATAGATTNGELRRLCNLNGAYGTLDSAFAKSCMPLLYSKAGWSTVGFHGFSEYMFERDTWWPLMGIKQLRFKEQLRARFNNVCGLAFKGICDSDLVVAGAEAARAPRSFVYVLTLNSHLPVTPVVIPEDLKRLCIENSTGPGVCGLLAHLGVTLRAISGQIAHSSITSVVVVGDHPPPFPKTESRTQFLEYTVPLYSLIQKPGNHATSWVVR